MQVYMLVWNQGREISDLHSIETPVYMAEYQ